MTADLNKLLAVLLNRGPDNALTRQEAVGILHMHPRDVQGAIADLQRAGWEIVSDNRGYWIPQSADHIAQVVRAARIRHRHAIAELADAARFMKIARQIKKRRQQILFPEAA